ncbi:glycosyltransferase family 2 protein [Anaerostipes sp.]|uniref:glycosyltransferase family 2 protein n=1 Tax=Anaerostipes sp. TaxID=1872530 RepID=UPI0025B96E10|nr:glycosyltransferase family 2 protein [Anaerostipes sp.]MBS7007258.1 glycosyltransferase family 2 protein [Anaerostipes sp.]
MNEQKQYCKPDISVVIPVYNAEQYLRQTMDYLVHQTLRSMEFIFIDDGSADGSMKILKEYQRQDPERIFIYETKNAGPGEARNMGIRHARADYIGFADADDYMEYNMFELMYEETKNGPCDLVCIPYYLVRNFQKKIMGRLSRPVTNESVIFQGEVSFWTKLIHRKLLEKAGKIPDMWFEDTAYMLVIFSYAEHIVYLDKPLYYYMKREGSITNSADNQKTLDTIRAENYALSHCAADYRDAVAARITDRILFNLRTRWMYSAPFIRHLKAHKNDIIGNPVLERYPKRYEEALSYLQLPDQEIPLKVYICEFGLPLAEPEKRKYESGIFSETYECRILNESNCNIHEHPLVKQAYDRKDYQFVAHYFAVKTLYEQGGIYLDQNLEIEHPFDCFRPFASFFGFLDQDHFTDRVFGCIPLDQTMGEILKTYEYPEFYEHPFLPLKDRIRNILTAFAGVELSNRTKKCEYPCAVFDSSVFVVKSSSKFHICSHDFKSQQNEEGYTVLPKTTVQTLSSGLPADLSGLYREFDRVRALKDKLLLQRKELREEKHKLEERISLYEDSTSWKATKPLRRAGSLFKKLLP